jgi:DNA-binding SARP family transcriptional activator
MGALHIQTLGAAEVWLEGDPVQWRAGSARALFFYLLTYPGGQSREHIIETLWDIPCDAQAANRFRVAIHRIRQALNNPLAVLEQHSRYSLAPEVLEVSDIYNFHQDVLETTRVRDPAQRLAFYQSALKLYQGEYLPELEADWAVEARSILAQEYAQVQLEVAQLLEKQGQFGASTKALQSALHTDPYLGEQHHQALIRKLAQTESKYSAVEYYRRFVHFLRIEVGDEPLPETVALIEQIKLQPAEDFSKPSSYRTAS